MKIGTGLVLACAGLAVAASPAMAQRAEVVLGIAAHAGTTNRAAVPGRPDLTFTNFSNMYRSAGNRWITVATVSGGTGGTATDQVVVTGMGMTAAVGAQEGVTAVGEGGEMLNLSGLANPQINDAGKWAIAFSTAAPATGLVVWWNGNSFHTIAKAGDPANAVEPGVVFGNTFSSAGITTADSVSFIASGLSGSAFGTTTAALRNNGTALAAANFVTVPANQLDSGTAQLQAIDSGASTVSLQVSGDGATTMLTGTLAGTPTSKVVMINNAIVMQVGAPLAGSGDTVASITSSWLESDGTWFVRGTSAPSGGLATSFISRNGVVIARVGQPITPNSTETWAGFTDYKGNNRGQYVVTGTTTATAASNSVLVLNGTQVIARAGDPVDLDNNGQFDDGLYIHGFRERCFLGNDGYFYVGARMKSAPDATSSLGANVSLIRIAVPSACNDADVAGLGGSTTPDGQLTADDVIAFLDAFFVGTLSVADIASLGGGDAPDGQLTADDVIGFLGAFFAGCP